VLSAINHHLTRLARDSSRSRRRESERDGGP
jgi:hypothetical protein